MMKPGFLLTTLMLCFCICFACPASGQTIQQAKSNQRIGTMEDFDKTILKNPKVAN